MYYKTFCDKSFTDRYKNLTKKQICKNHQSDVDSVILERKQGTHNFKDTLF